MEKRRIPSYMFWGGRGAVFLAFVFMLLALSPPLASAEPAIKNRLVIKIGTLAPKGVGWAIQVEKILIPAVIQASNETVFIKVYWGGVMGDDEDIIAKMKEGVLDGGGLSGQGVGIACPPMSVLSLPFLFNNYDEVDYIRAKMMPAFDRMMDDSGFALIAWIDQDFDRIFSISKPLARLEDFKDMRFINWFGPLEEKVITHLGAIPVKVDVPDVSTVMRQKTVEIDMAPSIWAVGAQLYSVARYINTMNLRYAPVAVLVAESTWSKVDEQSRDSIMAMREDMTKRLVKETRLDNAKSLDAMLRYGVSEVNPSPEELGRIRTALEPVEQELAGVLYSRELLGEIKGHLAQCRYQNH